VVEEVALRRWSRRSLCDRHETTGAIFAAPITTGFSIVENADGGGRWVALPLTRRRRLCGGLGYSLGDDRKKNVEKVRCGLWRTPLSGCDCR
jgi:hypothetical protein